MIKVGRNGKIISDKVAYGFPLILKHNGAEKLWRTFILGTLFLSWFGS